MYTFHELKKISKNKPEAAVKSVKLAVLADSATQFLCHALQGTGIAAGANYNIWEADYNQIDQQVLNPTSELYAFQPDYIIILRSTEHLLKGFYKSDKQDGFADLQTAYLESLFNQIGQKLPGKIITSTYAEINDGVFGNYAGKVPASFIYQLRKLNFELMNTAQKHKNLFLFDFAALVANSGYANVFDSKLYINGDMVYNLDILPLMAQQLHTIIQSIGGRFHKCVILDLDDTLWGGVIGDDGMQGIKIGDLGIGKAYTEFQLWLKQLKKRGIILTVCSKNTEAIAKEPFEKHPDMELRLDDIALFVANWENKVDNIRYIQNVLQIGFDSMVFIEDNPFERAMVRQAIPELTIPEMPEDASDFVIYLRSLNLFETASYTEEDTLRTKQYREEAQRTVFQHSFTNEADFLKSLDMRSEVSPFTTFTIPRVAQLTQRSNQFNLRTQRYTEADIEKMAHDSNYFNSSFTLDDKFGNHGLIAVVILKRLDNKTLFIDTWIMSCRVLKRGMENFVLYCIAEHAHKNGFTKLAGEYLPTPKNGIVKEHYSKLGFKPEGDKWVLEIDTNILKNSSHILKR